MRGTGFDASEDGTGRGTPLVAHALNAKSTQRLDASVETFVQTAPTLKAGYVAKGARGSRNYGTDADTASSLVAYGIRSDAQREGVARTPSPDASGLVRLRDPGLGITEGLAPTLDTAGVHAGTRIVQSGVRRLTPTECERLMGFPDGYTALPTAADGPRYAALGNSIAVPVLAWIFKRIDKVHKMRKRKP